MLVVLILLFAAASADENVLSFDRLHEIAKVINSDTDSTWKAVVPDTNGLKNGGLYLKNHLMTLESPPPVKFSSDQDEEADNCENNGLPKEFDARKHWVECASVIGHVYDQGNCGSCWAVATASTFTDRVCIASKGKITTLSSIQQLLSCCHKCFLFKNETNGCQGGWPLAAWSYIKRTGLSTGGDYGSKKCCQPYLHRHCNHHVDVPTYPACPTLPDESAPKCKLHCYNRAYGKTFRQDRIKVDKYYRVGSCAAMNEIYKHGSIASFFTVYEDFYSYKSGVYQHKIGNKIGLHVVRVIGWGEENGIPYWLAVNSWNEHWGDKGFFKIKRGTNEGWFEDNFSAGRPKLPKNIQESK